MRKTREIYTNPGCKEKIKYTLKVGKDGKTSLVESGKEDWQGYIQSFAESTDINTIVTRLANGDVSALNKTNGQFGDFTEMPKSLAEFMQLQIDCNNLFDSLPISVKKEFDMDKNKFFANAGSSDWYMAIRDSVSPEMRDKISNAFGVDVKPSVNEEAVTE